MKLRCLLFLTLLIGCGHKPQTVPAPKPVLEVCTDKDLALAYELHELFKNCNNDKSCEFFVAFALPRCRYTLLPGGVNGNK